MIRRIVLVAAAAVALILTPSAAMAYEAAGFSASVSDSTPASGQSVTVTIDGGIANAGKMIKLVITKGDFTMSLNARADANGVAKFTFKLDAAGTYKVAAFNEAGALVSDSQVLTVSATGAVTAPPTRDKLSDTGFNAMGLALGGGAFVLAGTGAVVIAKRRRSATHT